MAEVDQIAGSKVDDRWMGWRTPPTTASVLTQNRRRSVIAQSDTRRKVSQYEKQNKEIDQKGWMDELMEVIERRRQKKKRKPPKWKVWRGCFGKVRPAGLKDKQLGQVRCGLRTDCSVLLSVCF